MRHARTASKVSIRGDRLAVAIVTRAFDYHVNGATFDGAVVLDEAQAGKRPASMVFMAGRGAPTPR
jgi:hypothetical protein